MSLVMAAIAPRYRSPQPPASALLSRVHSCRRVIFNVAGGQHLELLQHQMGLRPGG